MDTKELITEIRADGEVIVLDRLIDKNGVVHLPKNVDSITLDSFSDLQVLDNLGLNGRVTITSKKSESFNGLSYDTIKLILDKFEEAFHKGEDGTCLFDKSEYVFWDMEGERYFGKGFMIGNGIMAVAMDKSCPQIPAFVQWYESSDKVFKGSKVAVAILDGDMWENIRVPDGLSQLIFQQRISLSELDFYGPLPDLYLCEGTKVKLTRINAPINEKALPSRLREAIEDKNKNTRHNWNLIFAAPSLCEEESSVSGYIKVTCYESSYCSFSEYSKCHDSVIEINLRYIMFVEPLKLKCYSPMVGSRIHLASFHREGFTFVDVYEPADVVMNKIKTASSKLDANTIMGELETILHSCNQD